MYCLRLVKKDIALYYTKQEHIQLYSLGEITDTRNGFVFGTWGKK